MPPIHLTREEHAALAGLAKTPTPISDLPYGCARVLLTHGLIARDTLRYRITAKGQLELFRQRYRNMATRRKTKLSSSEFLVRLTTRFKGRRSDGAALPSSRDAERSASE